MGPHPESSVSQESDNKHLTLLRHKVQSVKKTGQHPIFPLCRVQCAGVWEDCSGVLPVRVGEHKCLLHEVLSQIYKAGSRYGAASKPLPVPVPLAAVTGCSGSGTTRPRGVSKG